MSCRGKNGLSMGLPESCLLNACVEVAIREHNNGDGRLDSTLIKGMLTLDKSTVITKF